MYKITKNIRKIYKKILHLQYTSHYNTIATQQLQLKNIEKTHKKILHLQHTTLSNIHTPKPILHLKYTTL